MSKLNREQLGELLSAYLDDEVMASEKALVERILKEDEHARRSLEDLRRTVGLLHGLPRHAAPDSIADDLRSRIERAELLGEATERVRPPATTTRWIMRRLALAAAVGLAVWGGWWTVQGRFGSESRRSGMIAENRRDRSLDFAEPTPVETRVVLDDRFARNVSQGPSFVQKREGGADAVSLAKHKFEDEPVRLQLAARSEEERDKLAERLVQRLGREQVADLNTLKPLKDGNAALPENVYVKGKAQVNFLDSTQQQVLVQATPDRIEKLMDEISSDQTAKNSVMNQLRSANAVVMTQNIGQTARSQAQPAVGLPGPPAPSPETAGAADSKAGGKEDESSFYQGLFRVAGIDKALIPTPGQDVREDEGEGASATDAGVKKAAPKERSSLVERQLQEFEAKSRERKEEEVASGVRKMKVVDAPADSPPSAGAYSLADLDASAFPRLMTVVFEIVVAKPPTQGPKEINDNAKPETTPKPRRTRS